MTSPDPAARSVSRRAAIYGLLVLTFINLFNYLDRYVLSALVESLKNSELALSDAQLGALQTGFIIVYMLASPLFGLLGDRGPRKLLVAAGVALWSIATALGGLAGSFLTLFLARSSVGIGEAAYGTIAPAMLADYFSKRVRGRVFSVFFMAIPVGSALGYIIGGLVDAAWGWRMAFFVAGVPGLLLALLTLTVKDPPRGAGEESEPDEEPMEPGPTGVRAYLALLRNVPYMITVLGYAAYTFALGALAFWTPAFLERVRGVPKAEATVQFGAIVVVTGFIGTFVGGFLADALLKKIPQSYLLVSGIATLLAAPATAVALLHPDPAWYLTFIVICELLLFMSTGPINSAVVDVVPVNMRATAVALSILAIHVLGDVPSPPLIGAISDASSDLELAMTVIPVAILISGAIWVFGAWHGARRARRAERAEA